MKARNSLKNFQMTNETRSQDTSMSKTDQALQHYINEYSFSHMMVLISYITIS